MLTVLDVVVTTILYLFVFLAGVSAVIMAVINFKPHLVSAFQEIRDAAENHWRHDLEMWVEIVLHSVAEILIYVITCVIGGIRVMLTLPWVVEEVLQKRRSG